MKRLWPLALVCALLSVAVLAGSALGADQHQHQHHHKHHQHHAATHSSGTSTSGGATSQSGGASAKSGQDVLNDCAAHGQLTHSYTPAQLKEALSEMSAATKQYSNCFDVIQRALLHGVKNTDDPSGGSGGSSTTTIVIIVVIVLVVLAAIFGGLAVRRRRAGGDVPGPTE